jgi:hypothetical protein
MIPSKKQWGRWSLPSKLTAIGTIVGILSFGAYIIEKVCSITHPIGTVVENMVSNEPMPFEIGELNEFEKNVLKIKKNYSYNLTSISDKNISNVSKSDSLNSIRADADNFQSIEDKNLRFIYQVEKYRYTGDAYRAIAENSENLEIRKESAYKAIANFDIALNIIKKIREKRMYNKTSKNDNSFLDNIVAEDTLFFLN